MKLKTLKDLPYQVFEFVKDGKKEIKIPCIRQDIIKKESIMWVKEDKEAYCRLHQDDMGTWYILLNRWMKRLNITEEDLK